MPYAAAIYDLQPAASLVAKLGYQATVDGSAELFPTAQLVQLSADLANVQGGASILTIQLWGDQAKTRPLGPPLALQLLPGSDSTKAGAVASLGTWYAGDVWASCSLDAGQAGVTLCAWWDPSTQGT